MMMMQAMRRTSNVSVLVAAVTHRDFPTAAVKRTYYVCFTAAYVILPCVTYYVTYGKMTYAYRAYVTVRTFKE